MPDTLPTDVYLLLPKRDTGASLEQGPLDAVFVYDASFDETRTRTRTLTRHPIERGLPISDTLIEDPHVVTIAGIVSRTPMRLEDGENPDPTHYEEMMGALDELWASREPVTLVTGLRVLPDYVITNIEEVRHRGGDAMRVGLRLEQARFIESSTAPIPPKPTAPEKSGPATPGGSAGSAQPTPTSPDAESADTPSGSPEKSWEVEAAEGAGL